MMRYYNNMVIMMTIIITLSFHPSNAIIITYYYNNMIITITIMITLSFHPSDAA